MTSHYVPMCYHLSHQLFLSHSDPFSFHLDPLKSKLLLLLLLGSEGIGQIDQCCLKTLGGVSLLGHGWARSHLLLMLVIHY